MRKKHKKRVKIVYCPDCHYGNNPDFVMYSGECHGCGKILDEKAYFKMQMNKKLKLWRGVDLGKWR